MFFDLDEYMPGTEEVYPEPYEDDLEEWERTQVFNDIAAGEGMEDGYDDEEDDYDGYEADEEAEWLGAPRGWN